MIVALLCLTLFVDSAQACWWLRQHRSRAQVCRPVACRPAVPSACEIVSDEPLASETIVADDQPHCLCSAAPAEHATGDHEGVNHETVEHVIDHHEGEASVLEQGVVEHAAVEMADRADSVVVHGPTMVIDASPAQPAPAAPAPTSVVTPPKAEQPAPAAAQPMPVAATSPAVLPTPTPAEEPIPDLKPAIAPQSPVARASNEQPMPEPAAALEKPIEANQPVAPSTPVPAPVEDLAGGPDVKPPRPEPKEPNLFDLYDDADDEAAPSEEPPADSRPETADGDAGKPAEDSAAETTPADEAEMAEDEAEAIDSKPTEAEATDGDREPAEKTTPAEEPAAEEAAEESDAAPEAAAEQAEADPAEAAVTVPNEPMRRWTNDTGTHHTQGWLVEVRADRVRILKVNGRHTTVLTESLSAADRDYVSAVGDRMAAQQQGTSPAPSTTAGL
jgi:hypothetical protein